MNTVTSAQFGTRDGGAVSTVPPGDAGAWTAFTSAGSDEEFCRAWLTLQCTAIPGVRAGVLLLRADQPNAYAPAAVWPDPRRDVGYLTEAAQLSLVQRRGTVFG